MGFLAFVYGAVSYAIFLAVFLYAIGFVGDFAVPKTINSGEPGPLGAALVIDTLLLGLFAVQHSVMARPGFKRWWTRMVPRSVERSTYVLLASLALILLYWQWRPIPTIVWEIGNPTLAMAVQALSFAGWMLVLVSTFVINHFELFGLQQVVTHMGGRAVAEPHFKTPSLYKVVRHPIYLGFIVAFWAAPVMTAGHLLFAAVTTAYILVGIFLEERDLVKLFGDDYRSYKERVAALIPFWRKT
jgi:protein-S-isoprenylcysteine O-methyltransferase Ste14